MIIINKYDLCKFKDQLCNLVLDKNIKQLIFIVLIQINMI